MYLLQNSLYIDSFKMARAIWDDGFRPTVKLSMVPLFFSLRVPLPAAAVVPQYLVGLWRGGTPIGICVEEFFRLQVTLLQSLQIPN